jgi:hypothetical protein
MSSSKGSYCHHFERSSANWSIDGKPTKMAKAVKTLFPIWHKYLFSNISNWIAWNSKLSSFMQEFTNFICLPMGNM